MQYHSSTAQAAYHDLRRSLMDDQVAAILGTPKREERKGRRYWYDTYRIGDQVKKAYIGEDTPEMAARIENHLRLAQAALLIDALAEDRPDELCEAYGNAMERGPQWRAHLAATLKRMPETAAKLAAL